MPGLTQLLPSGFRSLSLLPPVPHSAAANRPTRVPQVVLVSSMGVTKPNHPLNRIGDGKVRAWGHTRARMPWLAPAPASRTASSAPTALAAAPLPAGPLPAAYCLPPLQILMWKHMAEEYLVNSGLAYTILHPGAPAWAGTEPAVQRRAWRPVAAAAGTCASKASASQGALAEAACPPGCCAMPAADGVLPRPATHHPPLRAASLTSRAGGGSCWWARGTHSSTTPLAHAPSPGQTWQRFGVAGRVAQGRCQVAGAGEERGRGAALPPTAMRGMQVRDCAPPHACPTLCPCPHADCGAGTAA